MASPRHADRHAARQGHLALVGQQALAGQVHRHQGGGAGGLDVDAGAAQVELVGDAGGQVIVAVLHQHQVARPAPDLRRGQEARQQVGVDAQAGEHADAVREALAVVARVVQGLPGAFESETVLGIHDLRLAGRDAEEAGVEELDAVDHSPGLHVVGIAHLGGADPGGQELLLAEEGDRLHALPEVAGELRRVAGAGETAGETDDGDALESLRGEGLGFTHGDLPPAPGAGAGAGPPCGAGPAPGRRQRTAGRFENRPGLCA